MHEVLALQDVFVRHLAVPYHLLVAGHFDPHWVVIEIHAQSIKIILKVLANLIYKFKLILFICEYPLLLLGLELLSKHDLAVVHVLNILELLVIREYLRHLILICSYTCVLLLLFELHIPVLKCLTFINFIDEFKNLAKALLFHLELFLHAHRVKRWLVE